MANTIETQFSLQSDCQKYHTGISPKNIARHINCPNAFTIRIAWSVLCWDYRYLQIAQTMAGIIKQKLAANEPEQDLTDMQSRTRGHDCGYYEQPPIQE